MKIIEVLQRVQALYPHPYKMEELIDFINELGSILKTNYIEEYKTVLLKPGQQLPAGIAREDIIRVIHNGRIIERDDFFSSSMVIFPDSERKHITIDKAVGEVEVIYRGKYEPVRYIVISDYVTPFDGGFLLPEEYDIRSGDILKSGEESFNVESVEVTDEGFKVFGNGDFTEGSKEIERIIDDLTICDAPYDRLYTEFVLSKVARFQNDYETENRALANYNSILEDFERFLVRNGKKKTVARFYNFW